jgi:phenylacetate-coenzyme A ligase PaaK-like adenylate-forming protein
MDIFRFRSAIDEVRWPAFPTRRGGPNLALQYQLAESQWWPEETLRRAQWHQLQGLLVHAAATVPYYRRRLAEASLDPHSIDGLEAWTRLPLLSRRDIQEAGDALVSERIPHAHGGIKVLQTSGSSGAPVRVKASGLTQSFWQALTLRHHLWHRFDFSGALAAIRYTPEECGIYPDFLRHRRWGPAVACAFETGPSIFLNIKSPVAQQFQWLKANEPDYLITYPSNLAALIEHGHGHGGPIASIRNVQTLGEVLTPELRSTCRAAWGVEIIDMYSTQEVGYVALQCPVSGHYHVQSETVLVEVLHDDGRACASGETGRVVVTALHNFVMPLIRYQLGDYATVGERCPCGRGLPVLTRIMGRVRNMLTLPDGGRIWPNFGADKFIDFIPVRQWQLIQKNRDRLELTLVTGRPLSANEEDSVRALMAKHLRARFEVVIRYVNAIPRGPGGKYEDFRSEITA